MAQVKTKDAIENAAKRAAKALYGEGMTDFKVRVVFPYPNEHKRTAWDVQCTFLLNDLKYTVDFMIQEKNGQVTNARLIDTMKPI